MVKHLVIFLQIRTFPQNEISSWKNKNRMPTAFELLKGQLILQGGRKNISQSMPGFSGHDKNNMPLPEWQSV